MRGEDQKQEAMFSYVARQASTCGSSPARHGFFNKLLVP